MLNTNAYAGRERSCAKPRFRLPAAPRTGDGEPRRVGFELEFSGLSIDEASATVAATLNGRRECDTSAEHAVRVADLGDFAIEVDWSYLKNKARVEADHENAISWTVALRELATHLVPIEVVCPPLPVGELHRLAPVTEALREAGAEGTTATPWAAYGVHVNAEAPDLDAQTLHDYLRAFCLLQWWLMREHDIDTARSLSAYVSPYPQAYMHGVLGLQEPGVEELMEHYLDHNPTRNRALDMTPLFAELDADLVGSATGDDRISARPAFHYRLPDCHIDRDEWSLARSWNRWCLVEALANDRDALEELSAEFCVGKRSLLGVSRTEWVARMDQWLHDHALQ